MKQILLGVVMIAGCTSTSATGITAQSCPPDSQLTYANFGSSFINENCLQCHGAGKDKPALTTLAQVQMESDVILNAAVYTDMMPKGTNMDIANRTLLGEWLACGAP
jgi:hypothetical protein